MTVKILVADDSVTVRKLFELTFAAEDVELALVDNGQAAIDQASGADLIFADASMSPDGYAIAQASGKPVIILASQQTPYDASKGQASGAIDHIVKPFDSQLAIDKAAEHAGAAPKPKAAAAAAPAAPAKPAVPRPPAAAAPKPPTPAAPAAPAAKKPVAPAAAPITAAANAASADLAARLSGLNLSEEQINGVLGISREVIEQVVWEVVPDLAETIIREEIRRLTA